MDSTMMNRAIEHSMDNYSNGAPFGAVIVDKRGKIIGEGSNQMVKEFDPTAHAEIVALRRACKNVGSLTLEGCVMYSSSEPCPMCLSAIYWAGMKMIYYANTIEDAAKFNWDDAWIYRELALPHEERNIPSKHVIHEKALEAFILWKLENDEKNSFVINKIGNNG